MERSSAPDRRRPKFYWSSQGHAGEISENERSAYELVERTFPPALTVEVGRELLLLIYPPAQLHLLPRLPEVRERVAQERGLRFGRCVIRDQLSLPPRGWQLSTPRGVFASGQLPPRVEPPRLGDQQERLELLLREISDACLHHASVFFTAAMWTRLIAQWGRADAEQRLPGEAVLPVVQTLLAEGHNLRHRWAALLNALLLDDLEGLTPSLSVRVRALFAQAAA